MDRVGAYLCGAMGDLFFMKKELWGKGFLRVHIAQINYIIKKYG